MTIWTLPLPLISSLPRSHDPELVWCSIPSLWREDWLEWSSGGRKKGASVFTQIESGHTWPSNWKIADSTVMRFGGDTTHQMKGLSPFGFKAHSSLETSPRGPNPILPKSQSSKGQSDVTGQLWEAVCSLCTLWGIREPNYEFTGLVSHCRTSKASHEEREESSHHCSV